MTHITQRDGAHRLERPSPHPMLNTQRAFRSAIPDSSVGVVRKVLVLDGRTRIIAGREPGGTWWRVLRPMRLTHASTGPLRDAGVSEIVVRRGITSASVPLAWLSNPD